MFLISCRRGFSSNRRFALDAEVRRYDDVRRLDRYETLTPDGLAEAVRHRRVLVLVHGYRNPIREVTGAYRTVEEALRARGMLGVPGAYDEVLGFLWPGFETVVGFVLAGPWANRSASFFRALLRTLRPAARAIDVQTHSLGARVALQALAFPHEVRVNALLLTAPAVDNECLEPGGEFHASLASCRRAVVYHSSRDTVLRLSYRVGARDRALGHKGPERPTVIARRVPNVVVVDCTAVVAEHGGYRRAPAYYAHWRRVLRPGPVLQFETLRP